MKIPHTFLLIPALLSSHAFAASLVNDFSSTAFPVENTDPQWTVAGGTYNNSAGAGVATSASFNLTGVRGSNFTISTQFTISSTTLSPSGGGVSTIGFGVLGLDSAFSGSATNSAYYLADFGYANGMGNTGLGRLRVVAIGDTSGVTTTNGTVQDSGAAANFAIRTGVTYTLIVTGIYSGGTLNMNIGLYDATGTNQIGTPGTLTDTSPLLGDNFGYRNRADALGTTDVSFDNLALQSVPEPSVLALILPATALLAGRRTRRAN